MNSQETYIDQVKTLTVFARIAILCIGSCLITAFVYAVGKYFIPFWTPYDIYLVKLCNPNAYVPVLDEFMRTLSDYTLFFIIGPMVSWTIAFYLLLNFLRHKHSIVMGLVLETVLFVILGVLGFLRPNHHYFGVNILMVLLTAVAFGLTAFQFNRQTINSMIRFSYIIWLTVLSVFVADLIAMNWLKTEVARPRPLHKMNSSWNKQLRVVPDEDLRGKNSFPSGHTTGTVALLTPLFWYVQNRKLKAGIFSWAFLLGCSRVYTAAHFPLCCASGAFLAFSIGTLTYFLFPPPKEVAFTAGPSENP